MYAKYTTGITRCERSDGFFGFCFGLVFLIPIAYQQRCNCEKFKFKILHLCNVQLLHPRIRVSVLFIRVQLFFLAACWKETDAPGPHTAIIRP